VVTLKAKPVVLQAQALALGPVEFEPETHVVQTPSGLMYLPVGQSGQELRVLFQVSLLIQVHSEAPLPAEVEPVPQGVQTEEFM